MRRFEGTLAVVTGASSGIGKATARRLLEEGAAVLAVSNRESELQEVAVEFAALGHLETLVCDISDSVAVARMAQRTAELGGAGVLINNAGICEESAFVDLSQADWERVIRVNLTGPYLCSQALVHQLSEAAAGAIVNTASTNGLAAEPRLAHYNASKGGLVMLTRSLAIDLATRNVRVNAVAPGIIDTPLNAGWLETHPAEAIRRCIPMARRGTAEEVASCIAFLASSDASYVTGEVLVCDGGQLAYNGVA